SWMCGWSSAPLISVFLEGFGHLHVALHAVGESLGGLERRDIMGGDHHGGVLGDIASDLFGAAFHDKRSEPSQVHILSLHHGVADGFHERLNGGLHHHLFDTGLFSDLVYDISFGHLSKLFKIKSLCVHTGSNDTIKNITRKYFYVFSRFILQIGSYLR